MAEKDLNQTLLEQIECPVCLEYMCLKIYVCVRGHSLCEKCWVHMTKCPICQADLSDTRNISMECMTQMLNYPCPNHEFGCNDSFKVNAKEDHVASCSFRKYKCIIPNPMRACAWSGRRKDLMNHYCIQHGSHFLNGKEHLCKWKSTMPKRDVFMIAAYNEMFYFHRWVKDGSVHFILQYVGKSEDAIQYCYSIYFFTDQFRHRSITFEENCQDDLKIDQTEVIDSGFAVTVPLQTMESYKSINNTTFFRLQIKQT